MKTSSAAAEDGKKVVTVPPSQPGLRKNKSIKDSNEKKRGPAPGKSPGKASAKRRAPDEASAADQDDFVEPAPADLPVAKKPRGNSNSQNSTRK
jgi:hypothetical protein